MEGSVLPAPAVAGVLKEKYVEARLHCDMGGSAQANKAIQQRLTQSIALPIYAVIDPATEERLGLQEGFALKDDFAAFLRTSAEGR